MRRSYRLSENQNTNFENKTLEEPKAKQNRSVNRTTTIATLDNGSMLETLKFLNYYQLAKNSLVSKRFRDLIQTHRHKLALLYVDNMDVHKHTDVNHNPTVIKMFDKKLSPESYNEWVVRNHYSKQIPFQIPMETQIAGMQSTQYERKVYWLSAYADYKDLTPAFERKNKKISLNELQKFFASIELSHENWPVFQHFFRLLTDPLIFIRSMGLDGQEDCLNLLAGAINPDYGRLQCHRLTVSLEDNMQNFISWIKGHVHCYKIDIINCSRLNHEDEFVDFFMTGGNCTSKINVRLYDPCKTIDNLVQKFIDLKNCDEYQFVESIQCNVIYVPSVEGLKHKYVKFLVKEEQIDNHRTDHTFEFVNNDIGKKLKLTEKIFDSTAYPFLKYHVSLKITNL